MGSCGLLKAGIDCKVGSALVVRFFLIWPSVEIRQNKVILKATLFAYCQSGINSYASNKVQ